MEGKSIKKWINKLLLTLMIAVMIITAGYLVFQSRIVQSYVISLITSNISKNSGADISIRHVNIAFFSKVILDDIYISDLNKDTLIYVDQLVANVDSLSFKRKKIHLRSITLKKPKINLEKIDSTYNFSFLISSSVDPETTISWKTFCSRLNVSSGEIIYSDTTMKKSWQNFFHFSDLNLKIDNIKLPNAQTFSCDVTNFQMTSRDGLKLKELVTQIDYADSVLRISALKGRTVNSELIADSIDLDFKQYLKTHNGIDIGYSINLKKFDLAFKDISFLLESFKNKEFKLSASGDVKGKVGDIRGKNVVLSVGDFTKLNGSFYINGLPDWEKAYMFLNITESYANLNEIRHLDLPAEIANLYSYLPSFLSNVGKFSYEGNFSGFIDDFVAYGTAYSDLGTIKSDLSIKPISDDVIKVDGNISTTSLNVGAVFRNDNLGTLTLDGEVNGLIKSATNYKLTFNGLVDSIDFKNYKYKNINLNGDIEHNWFNGTFSINDPNLNITFDGKLDLKSKLPVFEFVADVKHANLQKLKLTDAKKSILSGLIDANFEGNNIDNMNGKLVVTDFSYENQNDSLFLEKINLSNTSKGDSSSLLIRSDLLDGDIQGKYKFVDFVPSIIDFYRHYLPSTHFTNSKPIISENQFQFNFHIKNIDQLTRVFLPDLSVGNQFNIKGFFNSATNTANLESTIPHLKFKTREVENIKIQLIANNEKIITKAKTDRLSLNNKVSIYNLSVEAEGHNDQLALNLLWNNSGEQTYSGNIKTLTTFQKSDTKYPHIEIQVDPSKLYFADSLWMIDRSKISIDSTSIVFNNLNIQHNTQKIYLNGIISEKENDEITAVVENVDMQMLEPIMGEMAFRGKINGRAKLADLYQKLKLDVNLIVNNLSFGENGYLGDLSITSKWNNDIEKLETQVFLVKSASPILSAVGYIDPSKSELDLNTELNNTPISLLQSLMDETFYNQDGLANGKIRLYGKLNHFKHDGVVYPIGKASFGVSYIKSTYYTSDPVYFHGDSIIFKRMNFTDKYGNAGIFDGYYKHTNFMEMKLGMHVIGTNLQVLNTTSMDNDAFYGAAFGSGKLDITGEGDDILLKGDFITSKGTNINIPFESSESAQQYDFVEFVKTNSKIKSDQKYNVIPVGLNMDFDLEVTPEAKVQLIFNSQIGDVIRGEGTGNLQVKMDKNYNISMYGDYVIEKGDYLFTLQNVINKKFSIEKGGTLKWMGDPYNALIDISAVYRVKTSLYDLFAGTEQDVDLTRRIPVNCSINLTENLIQPKIDFKIELPTAEERIRDLVGQTIVTQEEVNRQIISLLMLGSFYTPEFLVGKQTTTAGVDLVGTTSTELLSNQLSNWLSKINNNFDIGINYRPGNDITNEQIELALSTQILNDRVTIDGNLANNAEQKTNTTSNFIGDIDINVKLTDNGKLQLKAYSHSNDNLMYNTYNTAPYTQGVGFSYREEFNSLSELMKHYGDFFRRKNKKAKKENTITTDEE